jgi:hypothetical protein
MTKPRSTEKAKSLVASRAPSANNHIESIDAEDGADRPSSYPSIPPSDQIVGDDSGMIKPPERPDD